MAFEELMGLSNRLLGNAQTLAAVAAYLRLGELDLEGDLAMRKQLERVLDLLGVREGIDSLEPQQRAVLLSFVRSYLAQAVDLVEDPVKENAWSHRDPALLQAQGRASGIVATLMAEAGLGSPDARILDVGTGVAGLAIAFCQEFPQATVVGIDPWQPSLELARQNVDSADLSDRITLHETTIQAFEDRDGFNLVWLPSFFIPEVVLDEAIARAFDLLRPGGSLVVGVTHADEDDPVAAATDALFTVRSGGSVLEAQGAINRLVSAGFGNVHEVERTWNAPLRFVAGTRP